MRPANDGSPGKGFAALSSNQIHQRHEHAMFLGNVAREQLPPLEVCGHLTFIFPSPYPAGWRRRDDEDYRCPIERCHSAGETMPGVLADQHCGAAPVGVEGANLEPAIDEPLLVEKPVGGQEEFSVHVADHGLATPSIQRYIERAIIEGVVPHLVESNAHIEGPRCSNDGCVLRLK